MNYALFFFPLISMMFLYMLIDLLLSPKEKMLKKFPNIESGKISSFKKVAVAMAAVSFIALLSASLFLWFGESMALKVIACFSAPLVMLIALSIFKALSSSLSIEASNKSSKPTR